MSGDGFNDALKTQLDELQGRLAVEHRRAVQRLEAKISALELENARQRSTRNRPASMNDISAEIEEMCNAAFPPSHRRTPDRSLPLSFYSGPGARKRGSSTDALGGSRQPPQPRIGSGDMQERPRIGSGDMEERAWRRAVSADWVGPARPGSSSSSSTEHRGSFCLPSVSPTGSPTPVMRLSPVVPILSLAATNDTLLPGALPTPQAEHPGVLRKKVTLSTPDTDGGSASPKSPQLFRHALVEKGHTPASPAAGIFKVLDSWEHANKRLQHSFSARKSNQKKLTANETWAGNVDDWSWTKRFMLHPNSTKRLCWEFVGLFLVFLDLLIVPLQVFTGPSNKLIVAEIWATRLYLTSDIPLSFMTGYVEKTGMVVMDFRKVSKQYTRTRLPSSCIVVALDWIEVIVRAAGHSTAALEVILIARSIRVFCFCRSQEMKHIRDYIYQHIHSEVAMISNYVLLILMVLILVIHVIACMWYCIHAIDDSHTYTDMGVLFWERYTLAFHYVLALFVGEHILEPATLLERVFTIVVLVFAFVISASIVGSLTTAMTRLQIIASHRSAQFAMLSRYLSSWGISRRLAVRVQRNAYHVCSQLTERTPESSVELLAIISAPLRAEIHYEVYAPVITQHPFFFLYNKVDMTGLRHICHTALYDMSISDGDVLFAEFEVSVPPKMYFVISGMLSYDRDICTTLKVSANHWISEPALWTTWAHLGTLVASNDCRLIAIDAQRFITIATHFSNTHISGYAEAFVQRLNEMSHEGSLSDIGEDNNSVRLQILEHFVDALDVEEIEASGWVHHETTRHSGRAKMRVRISTANANIWAPEQQG